MAPASRLTSPFFNDHSWSQETASTNDSSQSSLFSQPSQPSTQPSRSSSLLEPDLEADLDQEQLDEVDEHSPDGWAGYLSAQYQTYIVDNLKQTVFEKLDQLKASITSLQQNHARQEKASTASASELRATHDQIFSFLRDLKPIPSRLSALESDVRQNKEQAGHALSNLDDKVSSLKTDLGVKHDGAMRGLKSVQQQNKSLLETLEGLQGEVRNLQLQQTQADERLSSFQSEVEKALAPRQAPPDEAMDFLKQLLSRRADFMGLMESPTTEASGANVPLIEAAPQTNLPWRSPQDTADNSNSNQLVKAAPKTKATQKRKALPPAPDLTGPEPQAKKRANPKRRKVDLPPVSSNLQPLESTKQLPPAKARKALPAPEKRSSATTKQSGTTKQKAPVADMGPPPAGPSQQPPVRPKVQDMKLLFKKYNDEYKAKPPKAEYLFIWKFINDIDSSEKLIHLQVRLLELLPDHISQRRASHRLGDKFIQISKALTWAQFAMALAEV
ncbi:hypothetical protein B0H65DRAFT_583079 [Neurospora tetraspora]|uniref:Uncharacterized protein n=1 Tax=Neurospora tetraspora TaxID=94610 RepID=A0AAE0J0X2_9PEZI|nr:hypothetical protein B0H65DRAFT_583079 [Neurospora tetraspora]